MYLYRIISDAEWVTTKQDRKVPRCQSDERDKCVHLTRFEDLIVVAHKYFTIKEKPVVLEIDIAAFEDKIVWKVPTIGKPWPQPDAEIENIEWKHIRRYASLLPCPENENAFLIGEFR